MPLTRTRRRKTGTSWAPRTSCRPFSRPCAPTCAATSAARAFRSGATTSPRSGTFPRPTPGLSVGVDYLAKKWDISEADVIGALKECGLEIPDDEDAKAVYRRDHLPRRQ